jgi:hypothetical protein
MDKRKQIEEILFHDYGRIDKITVDKLCVLLDVVKPKGTFCQTPDNCQSSYYHQIDDYYCSKCGKTGLA